MFRVHALLPSLAVLGFLGLALTGCAVYQPYPAYAYGPPAYYYGPPSVVYFGGGGHRGYHGHY